MLGSEGNNCLELNSYHSHHCERSHACTVFVCKCLCGVYHRHNDTPNDLIGPKSVDVCALSCTVPLNSQTHEHHHPFASRYIDTPMRKEAAQHNSRAGRFPVRASVGVEFAR